MPKDASVVAGERVLGRFTVGERIGRGGHGTVHRAWDERLCRDVAIKAVEGDAAGRVLREAHAAARLNHPGIVTLYELGTEHGTTYLVSELVRGPNLRELASSGELSDRDLAEIGAELCAALSHAHAQGVIHRDLKPDNVLVRRRRGRRMRGSGERAMLADFGIATVTDEPSLTATGQVIGTLAYMAPEQAAGENADAAADVYSLALTLFELWTGVNPVAGGSPAATAKRIGEPLPSLGELRPELPPGLVAALDAALDPDPELRPALAGLHSALESLAGSLHPERPLPEPVERPEATPLPEPIPARPFAVLLAGGAIAALGLLAGRPGMALIVAALFVPAALLLTRPLEWVSPALAPLLGVIGLAPAYVVVAARHPHPSARLALAGLGWAWTAVAGALTGHALGVAASSGAGSWAVSGPGALDALTGALLTTDALATGLIWVGAAALLGLILEVAGPALLALLGLVWAAGLVAALGAVGGPAAPSLLLTPALVAALGWIAWDRAGRPHLRGHLGELLRPPAGNRSDRSEHGVQRVPARLRAEDGSAELREAPLRATRAARRHVDAALHGAGSRAG